MKKNVIAVFDIGKTNKKLLLFDEKLKVVAQQEDVFPEIKDDDGFECDDANRIEKWIFDTLKELFGKAEYEVKALNFTTYGATLVYISKEGKRLTPFYNYLKPMDQALVEPVYEKFGGVEEFCRITASPALGMLNSGLQALWLKKSKNAVYDQVDEILHLPQYLSFLLTGKVVSELTSIGCHTAMWDFDHQQYHPWLASEGIRLPEVVSNHTTFEVELFGHKIPVGVGIHDSSSSLAPYIENSADPFILISTGTWCISMNPFNEEPLTKEQLNSDCLCYIGVHQKPVKSSRLFLGHIFEVNVDRLSKYFSKEKSYFKTVKTDNTLINSIINQDKRYFFLNGIAADYIDSEADLSVFGSFDEAYHQLVYDVAQLCATSVRLVIPKEDVSKVIYISGGFARNEIFVRLIATLFKDKQVFTSEIDNSTALGAALMVLKVESKNLSIELGLKGYTGY